MMNPQWHILGAGAIGALCANSLAPHACFIFSDENKRLLFEQCRIQNQTINQQNNDQDAQPSLSQKGFLIERDNHITAIEVDGASPASLKQKIKQLLICTKAQQTLTAVEAILPFINEDTLIVLMQNGLGVYELLKQELPNNIILSATTTQGAYRKGAFHVVHAGLGDTWLGSLDTNIAKTILTKTATSLQSEHFPVTVDLHIQQRLWKKLAINCAINPLTAIYQCKNGDLLENPTSKQKLELLCDEINQVMWTLKLLAPNVSIFEDVAITAKKTAQNYSSMYQDVQNKRPTEIDFITAYLCDQALHLSIPCPHNLDVLAKIKALQSSY